MTIKRPTRRKFLVRAAAATGAAAFPHVWVPEALAQTAARGTAKHLVYIRLGGGFRFTTAFNADVAREFNPFGTAATVASGTEWGVGRILGNTDMWLTEERAALGLRSVTQISNEIAVLPCVDHEPLSGSADGNHQTGLERFLTGFVGGDTGIFTMLNYGLQERYATALAEGEVLLPPFVLGDPGMSRGVGLYAAHRPPVLSGSSFENFGFDVSDKYPGWATPLLEHYDRNHRRTHVAPLRGPIDAYLQTREATKAYSRIFSDPILKLGNNDQEVIDGISNAELNTVFGDRGAGRSIAQALRMFRFGCPAVYLDVGGYDFHSDEETNLPNRIQDANHMISALHYALKKMQHPSGGTYWDHTIVAIGSEFSRTARSGAGFNSARGSDHGGDSATRWMAMPFFGGPIGAGGQQIGETDRNTLAARGPVFAYRSVCKTLFDALGADHRDFFPADDPFDDLWG